MGNNIPVEILMSRYFVKYNRMDQLISEAFYGYKSNIVNIYIDLYGLYKTLFSRSYRTDISDYTSFTVSIVNMCAHYRSYFKNIGVKTNFFIISSYNIPDINLKFVAGYNKTFINKLLNTQVKEMVELNLELLGLICPYLPDIHFFKTKFESTVLINHLIELEKDKGNNNPNIIISSDIYPMQLCILKDTVFLKPRKYQGSDISEITLPYFRSEHDKSFWRIVCQERDNLTSDKHRATISSSNFMLLMALNRFPERNMYNIINFNKANDIIYSVLGKTPLQHDISSIYALDQSLYDRYPQQEVFIARYNALNIIYQSSLFKEDLESKVLDYKNLWDPDAVQQINSKYFEKNPIDLFRL